MTNFQGMVFRTRLRVHAVIRCSQRFEFPIAFGLVFRDGVCEKCTRQSTKHDSYLTALTSVLQMTDRIRRLGSSDFELSGMGALVAILQHRQRTRSEDATGKHVYRVSSIAHNIIDVPELWAEETACSTADACKFKVFDKTLASPQAWHVCYCVSYRRPSLFVTNACSSCRQPCT